MVGKRLCVWLCIWTLALGLFSAPAGLAMTLEEPRPDGKDTSQATEHHVTLEGRTIGEGETLSYETVAPELAGNPFAADYYPGELTVELAGQIVIEQGGCFAIGTLSSGNDKEASPVLRGSLAPGGLIVVRSGGSLILKNVTLDMEGEGLLIVQEPGGSVELSDMEPAPGLVAWAAPMVDNTHQQPNDLWLEEGTALTAAALPGTLDTYLQYQGNQQWKSLALQWDMDGCGGQRSGEYTLSGTFLDENGAALASVRPLTLTVHWYQPGRLVITDTVWMGDAAASAKLELKELPEEATEVWGEVSTDGGESWQRWEGFELRQSEAVVAGVFALPDSTPRQFRVRAANQRQHLYWVSDAVLLPKESEKPSDQGGNRGGNTAVIRPSRTPKPAPSPTPTLEPTPTPTPTPTPAPTPAPTPTPTSIPVPTPTPTPAAEPTPTLSAGHGIFDAPSSPTARPTEKPAAAPTVPPAPAPAAEPAPVSSVGPLPTVEPTATPEVTPSAAAIASAPPATVLPKPVPSIEPEASQPPSPSQSPTAAPKPSVRPSVPPSAPPEATPSPSPAAEVKVESPAPALQVLLAVAGVAVCALVGVFVARRKRK